ncbi:class I SAM-dependent methyltransferase [Caenimonas aquaedulcis]|uniref:Class I SAM-dependent methyltransferase n=1 Tax=Caenimonas aquaedulcis TaxID=2793270 RepID=A0A931MFC7_9BURK|nr:class I SAM-dependent methyltransferase [Caenimonas aquaedulcis]MBG9386944.1 class I SAM-dependent methyltransferase [Caenimonas aquaedulcis]
MVTTDDWTSGYVADIGYTYGYYAELNPLNIRLPFLFSGFAPPAVETACELGFGQGVSINAHAAAGGGRWWGTDFNPSQAHYAQSLAQASGARAQLFDESFAEFCARPDLPAMDFIALHGIWSWISDENRAVITDFVRRKLKVGGVLYVSYNTQPGWAAMLPVRELLVQHSEVMGAPGQGRIPRIDAALAFADKLMAANTAFGRANPGVADRLKKIGAHNRNYVAHEYFNRDWEPMSFQRMSRWLEPAKLSFVGSANCLEQVDSINLSPEQQALVAEIPDPAFKQTVRDFCINQGFRKDYWVKGPRRLTGTEQVERVRQQLVVLLQPRAEVTLKATSPQGELVLSEDIYPPILDALADNQPKSIRQLEAAVAQRGVGLAQLVQALMVLSGKGSVHAAVESDAAGRMKPTSDKLNRHLVDGAALGNDVGSLASPVTGGGISAPRFHQLFLNSLFAGKKQPEEWARDAWAVISSQSQQVVKDGKPLATPAENLAELTAQAREFAQKRLPVLQALMVA